MNAKCWSFYTHHVYQITIPFFECRMFFFRITGDNVFADLIDITLIGTYQIFHLPHIYKVFRDIFRFQLLRYLHDSMFLLSKVTRPST